MPPSSRRQRPPPVVGNALVRCCAHPALGRAAALPARRAAGRSVRAHRPLSGPAGRRDSSAVSVSAYYEYDWAPIGNLGVDVLVQLLGPILGLEAAVKLIIMSIPALTVAGFLLGRARGSPPLAADGVFSLLLRLQPPVPVRLRQFLACRWRSPSSPSASGCGSARQGRFRLRAILFVPDLASSSSSPTRSAGERSACCAFSAEAVRQHDQRPWLVPLRHQRGAPCLGHGAADPHRPCAWR